jgi:thiosulfate/3-mercaptopyruvate sulfurtransferase
MDKNISPIIDCEFLATRLSDPNIAIVDCRFSLTDPAMGRKLYLQAHIPHSVYAHLNDDLSGPIEPGKTGRHPLPDPDQFSEKLSQWGIDESVQVVAYDDAGGASAAARLWWMLRWLGHYQVSVLDGGWQSWQQAGLPTQSGIENRLYRQFIPHIHPNLLVDAQEIESSLKDRSLCILDSRTLERYHGINETIDPVSGHIPGAISAPYLENLTQENKLLPREVLQKRFKELMGDFRSKDLVFYCGSGVTATQNILALAYVGITDARLYAGSWSEWITKSTRPIEK